MSPKVSIVLPVYNGEKYLAESIESIINQKYQDWELIVVDDCSTDCTSDIIDEYVQQDSRIHAIHNIENQKLPQSLNIGFAVSKGDYLTWTSDDNMFKENALERMVFELDGFPKYGLVYARICNIDNNGTILKESMNCKEEKVFMSNIIGACFLYRREVYERIGNYDTTLFLVEDYDYWLRIAEQFSIHYIPETLYFYRRHEESLSETRKEIVRKQLWKLMDKHFLILMEKFKNNERMRYQIYFAFREQGYNCGLHNDKLLQYLPQLTKVQKDVPQKPVIVFGAGYYGELFYNIFKNKISYFADNNIEKVGTSKKGIEIISFAEMIMKKEEMDIVIAVDSEKLYPMMMQLIAAGGNGFYVMQEVMMLMNEN